MDRRTFLTIALASPVLQQRSKITAPKKTAPAAPPPAPQPPPPPAWTQWGGPHRNFQTEAAGLKDSWPASGPRIVWKRALGEGYSSPAVENGVLYTIYGRPGQEIVIAAQAETGKTLWERTN